MPFVWNDDVVVRLDFVLAGPDSEARPTGTWLRWIARIVDYITRRHWSGGVDGVRLIASFAFSSFRRRSRLSTQSEQDLSEELRPLRHGERKTSRTGRPLSSDGEQLHDGLSRVREGQRTDGLEEHLRSFHHFSEWGECEAQSTRCLAKIREF